MNYQPSPDELAMRASTSKWLSENDVKLKALSRLLQARNADNYLDEHDFFHCISTKIFWHGSATKGFINCDDLYLLRVAWSEGLKMLSQKRKYTMQINVSKMPEIPEDNDFIDHPFPDLREITQ